MEIHDLHLTTKEIIPPLSGGLKYAAKVQALFVMQDGQRQRLSHNFGEVWGKSAAEAEEKMRTRVAEWVATQR